MKKRIVILLLCIIPLKIFSLNTNGELILAMFPPVYETGAVSKTNAYANPEIVQAVIFNSLSAFIGILPEVQVLDENILANERGSPRDIARRLKADLALFGKYSLSGSMADPTASIELALYSTAENREIFNKKYTAPTDIEIFDAIDIMISDAAQAILKRKVGISRIVFRNFKIGAEIHEVFVNRRLAAAASNDNFSFSLKVPSGSKFTVTIKRKADGKVVFTREVSLNAGETANLSYEGPDGLQLFYERNTLHKVSESYVSGLNKYPIGFFGAPGNLTDKLLSAGTAKPFVDGYFANRAWGISFLAGGIAGTLLTLNILNKNNHTNLTVEQRNWIGLGSLTGTIAMYMLSGMFFNIADNDLERAVWTYNRFILFESGSTRNGGWSFPIIGFAKEF